MSVVDTAIYVEGRRTPGPGMSWIGLYRPDMAEVRAVAAQLDLPRSAVADAVAVHQRPKLARYGSALFAVLRPARYIEDTEKVELGELLRAGPESVLTPSSPRSWTSTNQ